MVSACPVPSTAAAATTPAVDPTSVGNRHPSPLISPPKMMKVRGRPLRSEPLAASGVIAMQAMPNTISTRPMFDCVLPRSARNSGSRKKYRPLRISLLGTAENRVSTTNSRCENTRRQLRIDCRRGRRSVCESRSTAISAAPAANTAIAAATSSVFR